MAMGLTSIAKATRLIARRGLVSHSQRSISSETPLVKVDFIDDGKISVIQLNNPEKMNALSEPMGDALTGVIEQLKGQSGLRAAVLTGSGKAFSAGGDLNWLMERHNDTQENNVAIMKKFYKRFLVTRSIQVPLIAALNGPAIGAGLCLAVGGCDIRVAAPSASMGFTFVKLGLHPGMAATHFAPLLLGPSVAADLLLTGRVVKGPEAVDMGLVSRLADDPVEESLNIARDICRSAPMAVSSTLAMLRKRQEVAGLGLESSMNQDAHWQGVTYACSDLAEGVKALQERRPPIFVGK